MRSQLTQDPHTPTRALAQIYIRCARVQSTSESQRDTGHLLSVRTFTASLPERALSRAKEGVSDRSAADSPPRGPSVAAAGSATTSSTSSCHW
jgi:hypothetical protein